MFRHTLARTPALLVGAISLTLVAACSSGAPATAPPAASSPAAAKPAATAAPSVAPTAPAAAPAAAEPTVLKMTDLQITSQAGYYIAQEKGYPREQGVRLEYVRGNPADMLPLVVSGQVEIGAGAISAGLFNAFARGIPVKMVADAGDNLANASAGGVVFRKDLYDSGAVREPADLRGRKIASATQASAPDIALDKYLSSGGLSMADLDVTVLPFPDILSAFDNKNVDAAYYQEPFTTIGIERGLIVRGPIGYDVYPNHQIGVTLFGQRLLGDRPLAVRYMKAYVRGVRDYVRALIDRDPAAFDEIVPILIERTTVKERALFEKAIPSGLRRDPVPNVQSIVHDQEWYLAHGHQTQRINVQDFVDVSFVEEAIRQLGPDAR
ncbi:MAG TPA: ABC transporter substrate-binding protein [Chloroflexota bacterium]|jgi:NitT/TauT family transport system substrate-binding protein